jgi:transcription termination factor Rho
MTKAELEAKHLAELHSLAAEIGVPRYRMLSRAELIDELSEEGSGPAPRGGRSRSGGGPRQGSEQRERPQQRRRRSGSAGGRERANRERSGRDRPDRERRERKPRPEPTPPEPTPEPARPPAAPPPAAAAPAAEERPRRRRRRRRFGRRGKGEVSIQDLLLPPATGRQAILCAESRVGCTALLRGVAADLAGASKGPDPVVLLIDPSPEELAEWKREAPQAEIVAAGQARHATDAVAQASTRAGSGEDVILLVDSLTRLGSAFGDADSAKDLFDAGRAPAGAGGGSLTVVAALERPAG